MVEVNGHQALAPIDLQTIVGDLITAQFVYLYKLPVVKIEASTLATAIKGSKRKLDKTCQVELNCGGNEESRLFYVAHLSGWEMIGGKPALQNVRATISAGTAPLTIWPPGMDRFPLRMWRAIRVTDQNSDLLTVANSILARADELAVGAAPLGHQFNPDAEFAALIRKEIARELPPLRKINQKINIISRILLDTNLSTIRR